MKIFFTWRKNAISDIQGWSQDLACFMQVFAQVDWSSAVKFVCSAVKKEKEKLGFPTLFPSGNFVCIKTMKIKDNQVKILKF